MQTEETPFYRKKPFLIIAGIVLLVIIGQLFNDQGNIPDSNNQTTTTTKAESPVKNNAADEKALIEIRKEKKVIEAFLTEANVLYVSVADDGTRRDGFAEYLCQIIKENGSTINLVKITKIGSNQDPNRDNAYGVLLGQCNCN